MRARDMPSCGRASGDTVAMTMTNEGALVPELDPLREKYPSRHAGFAVHSVMWNIPPCTTLWSLARVRPD